MAESSEKQALILDYWRAIELFSPQNVPRLAEKEYAELVYAASENAPLPWHPTHLLKSRKTPPRVSRRFQIYCGVYKLQKVQNILEDKIGKDPEAFDERSDGESCLFAFSVTDDGRPLLDTFILSTCAWAIGRTFNPGPKSAEWLEGFDLKASKLAEGFAERLAISLDDARGQELKGKGFHLGRPIEYIDIFRETKRIAQDLGVPELSENLEIRIKAGFVASRKKYSTDDSDFLNSFFVKDLGKIASEIRNKNQLGKGLSTFLTSKEALDVSKRIDVQTAHNTLFQQLSPELFPLGKWASKGHHPLVFSQQFAVNSMVQDLIEGSGMFAVNGPPGTGKTTLLRDLIATVVVKRATHIAKLVRPEHAFSGERRWKTGKFTRVISTWKDEFKGFEIVIASNNNGAVENVTLEIPGQDAIDPTWLEHTDYFPDFASRIMDQPAWAMIAARLGNKANRNDFTNRFWYGNDEADEVDADESELGFLKLLKTFDKQPLNWEESVRNFKKALAREQDLRKERLQVYQNYQDSFNFQQQIPALGIKQDGLIAERTATIHRFQETKTNEQQLVTELAVVKNRRLEHRRFRPGILEILFSLGKAFQEWRSKDKNLENLIGQMEYLLAEMMRQTNTQERIAASLEEKIQQINTEIEQTQQQLTTALETLDKARERFGKFFPVLEMWNQEPEARELSSPWADPEWNDARVKVFLAALQLHKAFIIANADTMRKSLQGAMDILSGTVPKGVDKESVEAAWTTLFFVIPVVSTTFASFDRLFAHLGSESLGWLLIDEAGQAVPQTAVGAIWRAKRSVVVGDPLQLEPVVTIPFTVQNALARHYKVDKLWLPGNTSVQQLTDRVSKFGTYRNGPDGSLWVGSPLRVHRRCDQPMFDISNKVAYDSLMVFGTPIRQNLDLPRSKWIHVESIESEGHWIPAEGKIVERLLDDLIRQGISSENIFLISPFRVVVRQLRIISKRFNGIKAGTIHTVQGKESEVIILVLGGDPHRPGAKQWASARPNLLNVAASRAKRRLYVVGNQDAWQQYRFFSTCVAILKQWNANSETL
jgi:hypothetical protein